MNGEELTLPDPGGPDVPPECGVVDVTNNVDRVKIHDQDGVTRIDRWSDGRQLAPIVAEHSDPIRINEYSLIEIEARNYQPPSGHGLDTDVYRDSLRITGVKGGTRHWIDPVVDPHANEYPRVFQQTRVDGVECRLAASSGSDMVTHRVKLTPALIDDLAPVRVVVVRYRTEPEQGVDAEIRQVFRGER